MGLDPPRPIPKKEEEHYPRSGIRVLLRSIAALLRAISQFISQHMPTTLITEDLVTSGVMSKRKKDKLGISTAISLTDQVKLKKGEIVFPLKSDSENEPERIIEVLHVVDLQMKYGYTPVLIHCEHGVDRSPTVAALYLYYKRKFPTFDKALEFVKSRNKKIEPKREFVNFIRRKVVPLVNPRDKKRKNALVSEMGAAV